MQVEPQETLVDEPEQQPQTTNVVAAADPLSQDFSSVLEDDWSDVHVKEDWLVLPDEGEEATVDISAVFEADDLCVGATLLHPVSLDVRFLFLGCMNLLIAQVKHVLNL